MVPKLRFKDENGQEFPEWRNKKIGRLTKVFDGTHATPKYVKKGIPFYSVESVTNNDFINTKFISEEVYIKENKRVKLERDDILMTRIGSVGIVKHIDWDVNASFYVSLALLKKSKEFYSPFLCFYIQSSFFQKELWKRMLHVAFPKKINLGDIGKCFVNLPCDAEQQKIASFLSSVDDKISRLEKKKTLLETYKRGIMQKIFTQELRFKDENGEEFAEWVEKRLGEISFITTGKSNRSSSGIADKYTFFDRSDDIRTSSIYLFDTEAIIMPGEGSEFSPKYFVGKFDLHQRAYAVMNFKDTSGKFLFYYVEQHKSYFLKYAVGSTVKSLRLPIFDNMLVRLPCKFEQQKIASFLSRIDKKIEITSTQIEKTREFKKGLLQQMFV